MRPVFYCITQNTKKKMYKNNVKDHFDYLLEIIKAINFNKITVITGSNASGKSLVTSQLAFRVKEELNSSLPHASMRLRTQPNLGLGALGGIAQDDDWVATIENTIDTIDMVINHTIRRDLKFLVIDEPEIGIGEELLLGLIDYLNDYIADFRQKGIGCVIVTHRKDLVKLINKDVFYNLDGLTEQEWINRPIIKRSVAEFLKDSTELFNFIGDRQNEIEKSNKK